MSTRNADVASHSEEISPILYVVLELFSAPTLNWASVHHRNKSRRHVRIPHPEQTV